MYSAANSLALVLVASSESACLFVRIAAQSPDRIKTEKSSMAIVVFIFTLQLLRDKS